MKFDNCLSFTLKREGGYDLTKADRGNWLGGVLVGTNYGISAPVLALWLREHGGVTDPKDVARVMPSLDIVTASAIYRARYWNVVQGDHLPVGVDLMVFDHAVNAGCGASVRMLQTVVGVEADGALGPVTLAAVAAKWPTDLIAALNTRQDAAYRLMRDFPTFGTGWMARLNLRWAEAGKMHKASLPGAA